MSSPGKGLSTHSSSKEHTPYDELPAEVRGTFDVATAMLDAASVKDVTSRHRVILDHPEPTVQDVCLEFAPAGGGRLLRKYHLKWYKDSDEFESDSPSYTSSVERPNASEAPPFTGRTWFNNLGAAAAYAFVRDAPSVLSAARSLAAGLTSGITSTVSGLAGLASASSSLTTGWSGIAAAIITAALGAAALFAHMADSTTGALDGSIQGRERSGSTATADTGHVSDTSDTGVAGDEPIEITNPPPRTPQGQDNDCSLRSGELREVPLSVRGTSVANTSELLWGSKDPIPAVSSTVVDPVGGAPGA